MSTKIFKHIQTSVVPLPIENIDTDQIIPARFLRPLPAMVLVITYSATGVLTRMITLKRILYSTTPTLAVKYWLQVKTSVAAAAVSTPPGPLPITAST